MDELATRAIIIGVSVFITIVILTVIIFEFQQISELYSNVSETDISFEGQIDELDKYRDANNNFNGLDVRNTFKKYKSYTHIKVCVQEAGINYCDDSKIPNNPEQYKIKYDSNLIENVDGYTIIFNKR